jgi:hypothetical protein
VRANVKPGTTLLTDGHASYPGLSGYRHDPRVVGTMAGHVVLPWSHRAFSLLKRWALGTYHGLRRKHVDTYLNEFVFRYNRRFYRHVSFEGLLGLATKHEPTGYWDIIKRDNSGRTPAMTCSSADIWRWVVEAGWQASDFALPAGFPTVSQNTARVPLSISFSMQRLRRRGAGGRRTSSRRAAHRRRRS